MFKKTFATLLALLMLTSALASCAKQLPNDKKESSEETDPPVTVTPLDSETQPSEDTSALPDDSVLLAEGDIPYYTVIVPASASAEERDELAKLVLEFRQKYGVWFMMYKDNRTDIAEQNNPEILVGATNRPESVEAVGRIRESEYLISHNEESDRIAIVGGNWSATLEAFRYFTGQMVRAEDDRFTLQKGAEYLRLADFALAEVLLEGADIRDYQVVVPKDCDLLTYYAGLNLVDWFRAQMGITLPLVEDDMPTTDWEFLLGNTNRTEDDLTVTPDAKEYLLVEQDGKIVMQGDGIYVAAAVGAFVGGELSADGVARRVSVDVTEEPLSRAFTFPDTYENAILMIGDGMGYHHVTAALNQYTDMTFYADALPVIGSSTTRSQSVINGSAGYTDSAAAATALATGYKTINGYLGKDPNGTDRQNVRELAQKFGAQTAVVTTDVITGATPAGFLCHNISRNNTAALQNEIDELIENGLVDYCKGSVGDELTNHTREALITVSDTDAPFFVMVEEGYIDKYSHNNDMNNTLYTVKRFNDVIAYVIGFVFCHPETALIITADHETGGLTADASSSVGYKFTCGTHTNIDVPLYALGGGTASLHGKDTENIDIARFMAKAYGADIFGQTTPIES